MDIWALIAGLAIIIGIVAGIVQVLQYVQERWEKKRQPITEEVIALSPPAPAILSDLPPRGEFIGREKEKARVWEALSSRWPLTCIDGIGGIGKTALALEVAAECLRASKGEIPTDGIPTFDGFIWTTAKDRELSLNDVLDAIARTLDYPGIAQQPLEEKQESVRKLLQTKPYLLIVDNFETVKDDTVRDFLLRLPEPSKALITSREQKLRQAWAVSLKGLEQEEALALIRSEGRRLGLASVEKAKERVLLHLYQATGGAPLAIKWAVGQIKQKGQSLDTVLAALHEAKGDIFEEVFARSWSLLREEARLILMVMPIFAASASRAAIEAASDVHHYALDEGLGHLVEMWLVEASEELDEAKRRYSIHPLTRAFAEARLGENVQFERDARLRAAVHFLQFARQHGGEDWQSLDLLEGERENILNIMHWCISKGEWQLLMDFMNTIGYFLGLRGYWYDRIRYAQEAMRASERLGNWETWTWFAIFDLGWTYYWHGKREKARQLTEEGMAKAHQYGFRRSVAMALRNLGYFALAEGNHASAQQLCGDSLKIWQELDDQRWAASTKVGLGILAQRRGAFEEASKWYREAQTVFEVLNDKIGLANALYWLGRLAEEQGNYRQARQFYTNSLTTAQKTGHQGSIARTKLAFAALEEQEHNLERALMLAREVHEIAQRLGMQNWIEDAKGMMERLEGKLSVDR